jgi:putative SOS response-associated peptidase YedK
MLRPLLSQLMRAYPVSKRINSPKNDAPDLIERAA